MLSPRGPSVAISLKFGFQQDFDESFFINQRRLDCLGRAERQITSLDFPGPILVNNDDAEFSGLVHDTPSLQSCSVGRRFIFDSNLSDDWKPYGRSPRAEHRDESAAAAGATLMYASTLLERREILL
jgi:hypothetical protein